MSGHSSVNAVQVGRNPFLRAVAAISTLAGWISAAMIVLAVAITCQMIFVRFVLNASTIWQTEMVIYLVIAATLIGLPYVQNLRGHVNVDLVPLSLPRRARRILAIFTLCASIAVVAMMLWYGYENWHLAWAKGWKSDTVWGVRLWIPYLALPVGFGLFLLQLVADLVAVILKIDAPFGLEDV
ncbi:MAG: TRAP-type C4-dicarboxylate transport system permease small subunit [Paracoccaceae bacterium]|jgi:TRAP-type C4-dicarboxylate transport system permease small subunit